MAKQKKKRDKPYSGKDAASSRPTVTRVQAVSRSRSGQWLHDNQKQLRLAGKVTLIVAGIGLIIAGIVSLF